MMSLFDEMPQSELDRKAREVFGPHVVVKSLANQAVFHGLPRYVTEYLIAKFVRPETWKEDLERIKQKFKDLLPDLDHRELGKSRLLQTGELVVIDNVEARIDLKNSQRWARVPAINDDKVRVPANLLEEHPGLLLGGLWGTVQIHFRPEIDAAAPNELVSFTPFQVGPPELKGYKDQRQHFTSEEWLGLMMQSAGYSPAAFPERRHRLLLLSRLVPLVERNVNLVELGPRQTGKTFLLRNVSPRVFTLSGGTTTPANLFYNLSSKAVGILGTRKVVVFDEIAHTSFGEEATLSTLKDYMESGQFSRGAKTFAADTSLVFAGNLDVEDQQPDSRYAHLFDPLPAELIDSAFLDRIHGYLPGWEIPKITPAAVATGVGFLSDYFGEVLVRLREEHFQDQVAALEFSAGMTKRDQVAVERIASGFIKLLYPDGRLTNEELQEVAALASEYRQRVHNQLVEIAPGEFKPRHIGCGGEAEYAAPDLRKPKDKLPEDDRLNREAIVGAVTGLGVIIRDGVAVGGDLIIVQAAGFAAPGANRNRAQVTGLHGRTLNDSVQTAYNIVRTRFRELGINPQQLQEKQLAVHLVRIAEPRDGPSAGIAFLVSIVSALTNRPVKPACAMTGEVTLLGEVKSVGGIPHKIKAAIKAGRKKIIIPAENGRDLSQLGDVELAQVQIVPVRTIQEVIEQVLDPA
jgi:ATP-dependent Lon protease